MLSLIIYSTWQDMVVSNPGILHGGVTNIIAFSKSAWMVSQLKLSSWLVTLFSFINPFFLASSWFKVFLKWHCEEMGDWKTGWNTADMFLGVTKTEWQFVKRKIRPCLYYCCSFAAIWYQQNIQDRYLSKLSLSVFFHFLLLSRGSFLGKKLFFHTND